MSAVDKLKWGEPRTVQTKVGERIVRNAPATPAFLAEWAANEAELRRQGYSVSSYKGKDEVAHWQKPDGADNARNDGRRGYSATEAALIRRIALEHAPEIPPSLMRALGLDTERVALNPVSLDDDSVPF
jgi:hypothetical protein